VVPIGPTRNHAAPPSFALVSRSCQLVPRGPKWTLFGQIVSNGSIKSAPTPSKLRVGPLRRTACEHDHGAGRPNRIREDGFESQMQFPKTRSLPRDVELRHPSCWDGNLVREVRLRPPPALPIHYSSDIRYEHRHDTVDYSERNGFGLSTQLTQ
jgi:hypothetical protein